MPSSAPDPLTRTEEVIVPAESIRPAGILAVPQNPTALIVFAHGSGSGRLSPRNRFVADVLNRAGLATMLVDLLTADEEGDRTLVFDIELLAHRLVEVTRWLRTRSALSGLPTGYFGASTGAGAALWAATEPGTEIAAVVSRGGRPDLAGPRLALVRAPTLLIVGGNDRRVLELNRVARLRMPCPSEIDVVPGATHLFEEPGTLEQVADLARDWFRRHLSVVRR
jgi:putative phosphoribosyl transferase